MVQRWAQELMVFIFAVVHIQNQIMCDVDVLSRWYSKLIVAHLCISNIFYDRDKHQLQQAYHRDDFISSQ